MSSHRHSFFIKIINDTPLFNLITKSSYFPSDVGIIICEYLIDFCPQTKKNKFYVWDPHFSTKHIYTWPFLWNNTKYGEWHHKLYNQTVSIITRGFFVNGNRHGCWFSQQHKSRNRYTMYNMGTLCWKIIPLVKNMMVIIIYMKDLVASYRGICTFLNTDTINTKFKLIITSKKNSGLFPPEIQMSLDKKNWMCTKTQRIVNNAAPQNQPSYFPDIFNVNSE